MPRLGEVSYSRDAAVRAIREYYGFLVKMYANESFILEPPEGGWPLTDSKGFAQALGKTDEVVELLRRLPYISFNEAHGAPECWFADWQRCMSLYNAGHVQEGQLSYHECMRITTENAIEDMSPHVIGLIDGGRYTPAFLLDTERGVVYWYNRFYACDDTIKDNPNWERIQDDPYDYAPESEADWRGTGWAIPEFFDNLNDQFRQLVFTPIGSCDVCWDDTIDNVGELQAIYREHGWPDLDRYRKKDCLRAVRAWTKEHCDGMRDHDEPEDSDNAEEALGSSRRAGPLSATPE